MLDDDDTYLVVAADKGTATFSDTANRVAERYGFWLGDAFASGGSNGLRPQGAGDHRARRVGVAQAPLPRARHGPGDRRVHRRRHRRHVGRRVRQRDAAVATRSGSSPPTTTATSSSTPTPIRPRASPSASGSSSCAGSTWDDYDRDAISEGGGVWPRSAKSIALSPSRRARRSASRTRRSRRTTSSARSSARPSTCCGTAASARSSRPRRSPTPTRCDRSSDAIRVDATELRCRVVAEGGNLGLTQRARIEFAARAAGASTPTSSTTRPASTAPTTRSTSRSCSTSPCAAASSTPTSATPCWRRSPTTSPRTSSTTRSCRPRCSRRRCAARPGACSPTRTSWRRWRPRGCSTRDVEFLPSTEEMAERRRAGRGLERPELAVLLAYAKRSLTGALLESSLPDDRYLEGDLRGYFPPRGRRALRPPARRAPAAPRAGGDDRRQPRRRRARPDLRLAARRRAGRRARRRRARLSRRPRRRRAPSERWAADRAPRPGSTASAQWELIDGIDTPGRGDRALVPRARPRGRPGHGDRRPGARAFGRLAALLPKLDASGARRSRARPPSLAEQGVPEELARAHAYLPALALRARRRSPPRIGRAQRRGRRA